MKVDQRYYRLFNKNGRVIRSILSNTHKKKYTADNSPIPHNKVGIESILIPIEQFNDLCAANSASAKDAYFDGETRFENIKFDKLNEKILMSIPSIKKRYLKRLQRTLDEEGQKDSPDATKVIKTMLEFKKVKEYSNLKWYEIAQQYCPASKDGIKKLLKEKIVELGGTVSTGESVGKKRSKKEKKDEHSAQEQ